MDRHIPRPPDIVGIGKQLVHEILGGESPVLEHSLLPVLAVDHVLHGQRGRGPYGDGLLARRHHVEADAALALGVEHDQVHDGHEHHVLVDPDDLGLRQVRLEGLVDDGAVLVHDAVRGHGGVVDRGVELEGRREGALDGAGEGDIVGVWALGEAAGGSDRGGGRGGGCGEGPC